MYKNKDPKAALDSDLMTYTRAKLVNLSLNSLLSILKLSYLYLCFIYLASSSSKLSNYDYEYFKMKHNMAHYRSYTTYFLTVIIFLASACIVLLIILFASCVINCKQRARLNYYNENEFFTYYNNHAKKMPVVSSVSSFSLTTATPPHHRHQHRISNFTPSYCMPGMINTAANGTATGDHHNRYFSKI